MKRHQPSLNESTWQALLQWSRYINARTGKSVSVNEVIQYLATGRLRIKGEA